MREVRSFCRFCMVFCGTKVTLDEHDHIVSVRGDHDDPMNQGYSCIKGIEAAAAYYAPDRLLHPLKRQPDGSFARIALEQALDEIAARMREIVADDGPEAVGVFRGAGAMLNASAMGMAPAFLGALGSHKNFTTLTIDQSAHMIAAGRIGMWAAPRHPLHDSDVRMMFGTNPLVALTATDFDMSNPTKAMKRARARGMKLIVIDPRRTETARYADVFLQPYPGEDTTSAAGVIDFPNHSRSYDRTRRAVRFWGHDSAIEASFFIDEGALRRECLRVDELTGLLEFGREVAHVSEVRVELLRCPPIHGGLDEVVGSTGPAVVLEQQVLGHRVLPRCVRPMLAACIRGTEPRWRFRHPRRNFSAPVCSPVRLPPLSTSAGPPRCAHLARTVRPAPAAASPPAPAVLRAAAAPS